MIPISSICALITLALTGSCVPLGTENQSIFGSASCSEQLGSWQILGLQGESITAIAVNPRNSKVIYVGTGRDFSLGIEGKLLKSIDGGVNWDTLLVGGSFVSIQLDPTNPDIVYSIPHQIIKSIDGGKNWEELSNGMFLDYETRVMCLGIDPKNSKTFFAGTGGFQGGSLYKSTDSGNNWSDLQNLSVSENRALMGDGVVSICFAQNNTNMIYAGTAGSGLIIKSTNAGITWSQLIQTGQVISDILFFENKTKIILAAVGEQGIIKSEDEGTTWSTFSEGLDKSQLNGRKILRNGRNGEIFFITSVNDDGWIYRFCPSDSKWVNFGILNLRVSYYYSDIELSGDGRELYFGAKGLFKLKLK